MNKTYILAIAAALLAAPLAFAHEGSIGAPKPECEDADDVWMHDYGAPSPGFVIFLGLDGSVPPCPYGDTTWDGHFEYAHGGTWIQAAASVCTDAYPDAAPGVFIWVYDAILSHQLGSDVAFSVYADTQNNNPVQEPPNCGDFESDYGVDCINYCAPAFPPGLDGSYQVYVSGTTGHIYH